VVLKLVYAGREFGMASQVEIDWQALLEADGNEAEVDQALALIPGLLVQNWADQVDSGQRDGRAWLRLQFEH
jgi:hypothetical protein